ncbi:tRNA (adenosine(37)-N6)-threonylcarbamoyltransferase complex ATPase subunit type 1 TsaE [Enterococcus saigonensis]|uniref:tRNA threonylcarbamoyladenosine biosynthesis protein TsaE n=1 Tax=Enterococcus saigonensis TaxID=1805431 RepID=A0A679IL97_9ENTE|nr:tRNA (adenosine(37)-N6)-threonylcarbamoyltransferase complex ATPase subunit type 1 TsaE [Enterococcus saigonensis]BCA86335.1 tRNA (adenosine(37)-N6)-threonylcarbamoyltransferase complex ATPase subunit type 1 TsaE [Enterococcus saigonensis]
MIALPNLLTTEKLGKVIGESATGGDVIILTGELGAGKTTITKGIAQGLGISRMVKSPTYTIIREYEDGRLPLYHMDVYRIGQDADELGLEEYFEGNGLSIVEWGKLLGEALPVDYLELRLSKITENEFARQADFKAVGSQSEKFLDRILKNWTI